VIETEIDIRKKLQDQANLIVESAINKSDFLIPPDVANLLNAIVVLSLKQGYVWGVTSVKQTADYMLNNIKGIN